MTRSGHAGTFEATPRSSTCTSCVAAPEVSTRRPLSLRAMGVFWSRGYHATARPDLLRATKLSHGSLYAAFGDKHSLFLRALDRYVADALTRMRVTNGGVISFLDYELHL